MKNNKKLENQWAQRIQNIKIAYKKNKKDEAFGEYHLFHKDAKEFIENLKNKENIENNEDLKYIYAYNTTLYEIAKLCAIYNDISLFMYIKDFNYNEDILEYSDSIIVNDFIHNPYSPNDDDETLPFFRAALDNQYVLFCQKYVQKAIKEQKIINFYYFFSTYDPSDYFEADNINFLDLMKNTIGEYLITNASYGYKNVITQDFECPEIIKYLIERNVINQNNFSQFLYSYDIFNTNDIVLSPNSKNILNSLFDVKNIDHSVLEQHLIDNISEKDHPSATKQSDNIKHIIDYVKIQQNQKPATSSFNRNKML